MRNLVTECSDEVSLLTEISKTQFQAEPTYQYEEIGQGDEILGRFKATLSFNNTVVSYAIGENKKESKLNACKHALTGMVPELYEDWQKEHNIRSVQVPI